MITSIEADGDVCVVLDSVPVPAPLAAAWIARFLMADRSDPPVGALIRAGDVEFRLVETAPKRLRLLRLGQRD